MWRAAFLTVVLALTFAAAAAACGDDDSGKDPAPPAVVDLTLDAAGIQAPATLRPGYTTFRVTAGADMDNAIILVRLNDGVARAEFEQILTANEEDAAPFALVVGGSGSTGPGEPSEFTVDLSAGDYATAAYGEEGELLGYAFITVAGDRTAAQAPAADGEIDIGPGMVFSLPSAFDGHGTFEVVNNDSTTHMAQIIRLEDGTQPEDVVGWAASFLQGEMPAIAPAGGLGALDAGQEAWISLDLDPGNYMFVCFIGDESGLHIANGMWSAFTVS